MRQKAASFKNLTALTQRVQFTQYADNLQTAVINCASRYKSRPVFAFYAKSLCTKNITDEVSVCLPCLEYIQKL